MPPPETDSGEKKMITQANAVTPQKIIATHASRPAVQRGLLTVGLVVIDLLTILFGFWAAYFLRFETGITWFHQHDIPPHDFYQQFVFFLAPVFVIVFAIFGLYDSKNLFSGTREYALVFNASTLGIMLVILFTFFDPELVIARAWVVMSWVLVTGSVGISRFAFRRIVHQMREKGQLMTRTLIIGANEEGQAIAQQLGNNAKAGIQVVGFIDDTIRQETEPHTGLNVLGGSESIIELIQKHNIHEVIIVSTALSRLQLLSLAQTLNLADIPIRLSSGLYELLTTGVEVQDAGNVPLITINKVRLTGSDVVLKRGLDLLGATCAILLFLPLMAVIAILIKLDSPGSVIYRRKVVGVGGKQFDAFKFRTMTVDADARLAQDAAMRKQFEQNYKLKNDPRVTRIGRFLRGTSLDELPQLFNVFLGQMSLVGPRMITAGEKSYYGKWSMNLFTVKPGITGLWQVSGRSNVSYNERVRLDMHYIRNYSIWMDIYLLWLTIPAVLKRRGAY
jgi:exopolysaccharide biosynthesis polyprenyl glycosylphosphotransferase